MKRTVICLFLAALLAGCSSVDVTTDFDSEANFASYRHLEVRIEDLFASGDRVAARITWVGRRSNGEHTTRETIDILRVSGGRAIEHWGAAV